MAGWSAALWIAYAAEDYDPDVLGYDFANGQAYVQRVSDSKRYRSDLERIGGKAAVYADELVKKDTSGWIARPNGTA